MKQVPAVFPEVCFLCTKEKRMIMLSDKSNKLNTGSELFSKSVDIGTVTKLLISSARKYKHI